MHVLATGGAGYVGSHVVRALIEQGHIVTVLDDLSSGHRQAVADGARLIVGRCGDAEALERAFPEAPPDGVMHLAARCSVSESMADPALYYRVNVVESVALLEWMVRRGVRWIVHSSTCSVYGEPEQQPIDERTLTIPINAYGATKLAVDRCMVFFRQAYGIGATSLRYFNAAGADPSGDIGEDKIPASNLLPRVLAVAAGESEIVRVFGNDYPSPDGTGVRDYVHVCDLASAHLAAMTALASGDGGDVYNLGTGKGHSVLEVVEAARKVTGHRLPVEVHPRRTGDSPALVAGAEKARTALEWKPRRSGLNRIVEDAWRWHQRHPRGFGSGDRV